MKLIALLEGAAYRLQDYKKLIFVDKYTYTELKVLI